MWQAPEGEGEAVKRGSVRVREAKGWGGGGRGSLAGFTRSFLFRARGLTDLLSPTDSEDDLSGEHIDVNETMEPVIQDSSKDDVFPAKKIVKQRIRDGKPEYLIEWLQFPASHNSWEKAENILDERLFTQFYKKSPHQTL